MKTIVGTAIAAILFICAISAFAKNVNVTKVMDDEPRPIRGTVKNQAMNLVAGAAVYLYPSGSLTAIETTSTDDAGEFVFSPVKPGNYTVKVVDAVYGTTNTPATVTNQTVILNIILPN
jgi:hypothetical protein